MPLHVSRTCAHRQEVKIALHSLWYHHTYRCDDTRGCVMQFWPPDDEQMCSKHVETWNKLIVKQKFCASSWLITEINILRCTVSKTSKKKSFTCFAPPSFCIKKPHSGLSKCFAKSVFVHFGIIFIIIGSSCFRQPTAHPADSCDPPFDKLSISYIKKPWRLNPMIL